MINVLKYEAKEKEEIEKQIKEELKCELDELIIKYEFTEGKLFKSQKYVASVIKKEDIKILIDEVIKIIGQNMNIVINNEILVSDEIYNVTLISNNNSILIGKEGKTLNALQTLVRQIVRNKTNTSIKINLDVSNYKMKKMKNIERIVRQVAKEVKTSKVTVSLDPMNSYERRYVHTIISEYPELETESVGEGKERHITIKYKEI